MKKTILMALCFCLSATVFAQKMSKDKNQIITSIEKHKEELIKISDSIWALAETAFELQEALQISQPLLQLLTDQEVP